MNINKQQSLALKDMFETNFNTKYQMAKYFGITEAAVHGWFKRGRISAVKALEAEQRLGYPKEKLRPDIRVWYVVDLTA